MIRQIDWDDLRILLALTRHSNLTAVARHLHVDQSTVSRRIAHLESDFGVRLVERKRERLTLTEFARQSLEHLQEIEKHVQAITEMSEGHRERHSPPLIRISTYEAISTFYLAERLGEFQEQQLTRIEIVPQLKPVNASLRDADVFLSFYEPDPRGLDKTRVGTITIRLYASEAYLKRYGTPASRDELRDHRFISYIPDLLDLESARYLDEVIADRFDVLNSTSMSSQMAAAAGGMGIVMLPSFAARREPRLRSILATDIAIQRPIWLSAPDDLRYTPRIKSLIAFLTKTLLADQDILNEDRQGLVV